MSQAATLPAAGPLRWLPGLLAGWPQVLRTLAAFTLALYTAFALELDSPSSAGLTVLIIAASSRGAILQKSLYRLLGSFIGGLAAILLVAFFAQAPWLFLAGFALWLGLCTFLASLLRYFRSYGAVLAGYTVAIVGIPALSNPENVLLLACGRVAVVSIGILSTAFVFLVTDPGRGRSELVGGVGRLLAATAAYLRDLMAGGAEAAALAQGTQIIGRVEALDQAVEFAAVEDTGIDRHADDIRLASAALFALVFGARRTVARLRDPALAARPDIAEAAARIAALASAVAGWRDDRALTARLGAEAQAARAAIRAAAAGCTQTEALAALLLAAALANQLAAALETLLALQDDRPRAPRLRLSAYVNPVTALRNGMRAALAVALGGAFWIASGWSAGGSMLALLAPLCALLGTLESAAAASIGFFKGLLVASVLGLVVTYGVLPLASGFPMLLLVVLPILAVALFAMQRPALAGPGMGFAMFFMVTVGPTNPMTYDLAAGLNGAFAFLVGGACTVLTFFVLLPANPPAEARVLQRSIRRALRRLAGGSLPPALRWEHLQYQKLVRLSRRLAGIAPARAAAALTDGGEVVLLGRAMIRLREMLARGESAPADQAVLRAALKAMRQVIEDPRGLAATARAAGARLVAADEPAPAARKAAALLGEIAALAEAHADFLAAGDLWTAADPASSRLATP
jgi:uncharacterized membrane protein YccC